jgi:hypothetical protein
MTQTLTKTTTYTVADVSRTFESFRSNLRAYSESAGVEEDLADARADDVIAYARAKYLSTVSVILSDSQGARLRVAKFVVSESATGWKTDMPGDNLWPRAPGGSIRLICKFTDAWGDLTPEQQAAFKRNLKRPWGPTNEDTTFSDMLMESTRTYASNAYGLTHTTYRSLP